MDEEIARQERIDRANQALIRAHQRHGHNGVKAILNTAPAVVGKEDLVFSDSEMKDLGNLISQTCDYCKSIHHTPNGGSSSPDRADAVWHFDPFAHANVGGSMVKPTTSSAQREGLDKEF